MAEEKMEFKAELKQVMDIIVHSLYSHKEIFLRELLSNASDAIAKIRFDALTDTALTEGDSDFKIVVTPDKDNNTITISDNGCGLTKEGLIENLGTIARSGTKAFIEKIKQAKEENAVDLIGQFGVGFYSSFMVANKVEVITKAAKEEKGVKWVSSGEDTFSIEEVEKESRGTDIILHLREDATEYLDIYRIRSVIKKFSDFVEYPIILKYNEEKEVEGEDGEKTKEIEPKEEIANSQQAIWVRPRNEITEEEYEEFYKHISHDFEGPLKTIHYSAEGTQEFKALLFLPKRKPFDFFMQNSRKGIQLYVNRVFITEECEKLLPNYLEFVRGVVDSSDLPLNVSREMLQEDRQLASIRKAITSKIFSTLKDMLNNDYENYVKFWEEFGVILKSGISSDYANKDKIADLILCKSTRTEKDDEAVDYVTLEQYVEAMPEDQKEIYYMIAESREMVENSPYMEQFKAKGYEVLVLTDPVDEIVVQGLGAYKEKTLKAIDRGELEVEKETEAEKEQKEKDNKDIIAFIKDTLGDDIKEVRISNRLKESPACVVGLEGQYGAQMEKMMKEMGADTMKREAVLEINPEHSAIEKIRKDLEAKSNEDVLKVYIKVIYDAALVAAGEKVKDPSSMLKSIADIISGK